MTITVQSHDTKADAQVNEPTASAPAETKDKTESAPADQAEQNEASVSETGATEATEGEESESTESESHNEEESKEGTEEKPAKKKGGFQRRIDKLNQRFAAKEQEAEYWKQQALKSAGTPKEEPKVETKSPAAAEVKPKPDKFDTHAEYVEALTEWTTEQKLKEREQKAAKTRLESEQATLVKTYQERRQAFAEKTPDFEDVIAEADGILVSPAVQHLLLSSENGPEVSYELAKNPDEFARICKLAPLAAAKEIGKIEAKIASKTASESKHETKRVSSAPKPIAPVGGGGKASAPPKTLEEAANQSYAAFKKLREEQLKTNRRRA